MLATSTVDHEKSDGKPSCYFRDETVEFPRHRLASRPEDYSGVSCEMKAFVRLKLETFIRTRARRLNILTPSPSGSNHPTLHYRCDGGENERRYIRELIEFHLLMGVQFHNL